MSTADLLAGQNGPSPTGSTDPHARDISVIAVIAFVHGISHFFHLIITPLFPWLVADFGFSYGQLGLLMTVFFVVSGVGQSAAGFLVDRIGAVPVLFGALALFALGALILAVSQSFAMLALGMVVAGMGNAPFHPIDFSILNSRVRKHRLGRAYAVHGMSGSLGWAFAPVFLVALASTWGWRSALIGASLLALSGLIVAVSQRALLVGAGPDALRLARGSRANPAGAGSATAQARPGSPAESSFAFLRSRALWLSFGFFVIFSITLGGIQSFAPAAAGQLFGLDIKTITLCLTAYMLGSAIGMVPGGYAASDPDRAETLISVGYGLAFLFAVSIVYVSWPPALVPLVFGLMGFSAGFASPARDLLIKRSTPPGATGRVYGVVYSGLDVGLAIGPAVFGLMMDAGLPAALWLVIASMQIALILLAWISGRVSRQALASAQA